MVAVPLQCEVSARLPRQAYKAYRLDAIFLGNKWDPQLHDRSTVADRAIVLDLKDHERALVWVDGRFARILPPGHPLILYGPWLSDQIEPVASNLAFDADLKARDPEWGLRRVEHFAAAAASVFELVETRAMPA